MQSATLMPRKTPCHSVTHPESIRFATRFATINVAELRQQSLATQAKPRPRPYAMRNLGEVSVSSPSAAQFVPHITIVHFRSRPHDFL